MIGNDPLFLLMFVLMGTFLLRAVGVIGAGHMEQDTPLFRWIGCVAFAIAAGIMAKILFIPSGVLAEAPLISRLGGAAVGLLAAVEVREAAVAAVASHLRRLEPQTFGGQARAIRGRHHHAQRRVEAGPAMRRAGHRFPQPFYNRGQARKT